MLLTLLLLACAPDRPEDPGPDPVPGLLTGAPTTGTVTEPLPDPGLTRAAHDRDFLPAALDALNGARERVKVAQYLLYDGPGVDDLLDAIGDASARGVPVQVLVDETGDETEGHLASLGVRGVQTQVDSRHTTLHNKLIIADDAVLVGSHNFTSSAVQSNHEGSVFVRDAEVADWYAAWFDAVWVDSDAMVDLPPLERTDLLPVADRQILPALTGCMDGATERIELLLYALMWDDNYPESEVDRLLDSLEAAHGRGVSVDVVLDQSSWITENQINEAAIARLGAAGIPVKRTPGNVTTHAKVLRCDEVVIVSDANWSYSGMALTHGTHLVATDPAVVEPTVAWLAAVRETAE